MPLGVVSVDVDRMWKRKLRVTQQEGSKDAALVLPQRYVPGSGVVNGQPATEGSVGSPRSAMKKPRPLDSPSTSTAIAVGTPGEEIDGSSPQSPNTARRVKLAEALVQHRTVEQQDGDQHQAHAREEEAVDAARKKQERKRKAKMETEFRNRQELSSFYDYQKPRVLGPVPPPTKSPKQQVPNPPRSADGAKSKSAAAGFNMTGTTERPRPQTDEHGGRSGKRGLQSGRANIANLMRYNDDYDEFPEGEDDEIGEPSNRQPESLSEMFSLLKSDFAQVKLCALPRIEGELDLNDDQNPMLLNDSTHVQSYTKRIGSSRSSRRSSSRGSGVAPEDLIAKDGQVVAPQMLGIDVGGGNESVLPFQKAMFKTRVRTEGEKEAVRVTLPYRRASHYIHGSGSAFGNPTEDPNLEGKVQAQQQPSANASMNLENSKHLSGSTFAMDPSGGRQFSVSDLDLLQLIKTGTPDEPPPGEPPEIIVQQPTIVIPMVPLPAQQRYLKKGSGRHSPLVAQTARSPSVCSTGSKSGRSSRGRRGARSNDLLPDEEQLGHMSQGGREVLSNVLDKLHKWGKSQEGYRPHRKGPYIPGEHKVYIPKKPPSIPLAPTTPRQEILLQEKKRTLVMTQLKTAHKGTVCGSTPLNFKLAYTSADNINLIDRPLQAVEDFVFRPKTAPYVHPPHSDQLDSLLGKAHKRDALADSNTSRALVEYDGESSVNVIDRLIREAKKIRAEARRQQRDSDDEYD